MKIDLPDTDSKIGQMMRLKRERKGWLLASAAVRYGVSQSFLCELEKGKKRWLATDVVKFAKILMGGSK